MPDWTSHLRAQLVTLRLSPAREREIVFGHVGRLVTVGLIAGGLAACSLSSAAGRFLFGLDPTDPRAYAIAMVTLLAAAFLAALLPAPCGERRPDQGPATGVGYDAKSSPDKRVSVRSRDGALPLAAALADAVDTGFFLPTKTSHQPKCIASR